MLKSNQAGEVAAEHRRPTDDLDGGAVLGLAQFPQPFVAAKRQPRMEVIGVLGLASSVADVEVEYFVALDPIRRRVVLSLERRAQVVGL